MPRLQGIAQTSSHLASSTVITAALGLVFWALATRLYSAEEVGLGSAQIAAATLAATAAQLNLGVMLARYLPAAGKYSPWILRRTYAVVLAMSVIVAVGFLGLGLAPESGSWQPALLFLVAVPCLALFAVQDLALVALGSSRIVPIENMLFAIAKILLLPALMFVPLVSGVFLAWVVPATLSVVAITWYMARRATPEHVARSTGSVPLPPRGTLRRLVMWQYAAGLANQAYKSGVPLVVAAMVGLQANGEFTVPWMVFVAFGTIIQNVLLSFQYHTRRGEPVTRKVFVGVVKILAVLAGLGAAGVVIGAGVIVRIVSPDFVDESVTPLMILGAAVPMLAVWNFYLSFVWLEGRLARFAAYDVVVSAAVVGGAALAVGPMGTVGAAWAVLVVFTVAAAGGVAGLVIRWRVVVSGQGDWTRD